jgi:murein DD-endopeptidase MepM/ murein hydrolase activator NlpD
MKPRLLIGLILSVSLLFPLPCPFLSVHGKHTLSSGIVLAQSSPIRTLESQQHSNRQKLRRIKQLKQQILQKEYAVTSHMVQNQRRLDASRQSLEAQSRMLADTQSQLAELETTLDIILAEQQKLAVQVGNRLRSLYMGERISFLQSLITAGNLSTMLDRIYYKKRVFAQDKQLYADYILKTRILEEKKQDMARQKVRQAQTVQRIETYQNQLRESVSIDKLLVEKLRTSRETYEMAENQLERESYAIERQIIALTQRGGFVLGSTGRFIRPILAGITSGFGWRVHPIFRSRRFHSGLDFGGGYGAPIRAADGGRVIQSGWQGGYGKVVIINHGSQRNGNLATLYGHMSRVAVGAGQQVAKGQVVGYVGSTGYSTGPHLHFEVRINGRPVNPLGFLR